MNPRHLLAFIGTLKCEGDVVDELSLDAPTKLLINLQCSLDQSEAQPCRLQTDEEIFFIFMSRSRWWGWSLSSSSCWPSGWSCCCRSTDTAVPSSSSSCSGRGRWRGRMRRNEQRREDRLRGKGGRGERKRGLRIESKICNTPVWLFHRQYTCRLFGQFCKLFEALLCVERFL